MMELNYKGLRKVYEFNRTLQHDYKNHLLALSELVKENKNQEALEYIYAYIDYTKNSENDVKSGNDIVDIIVNSKMAEAKEKLIEFKYDIEYLNDLPIADIDLCALLANLLDNAIEACEKVIEKEVKISLNVYRRNDLLIIQIINSVSSSVMNKPQVFKTDKANCQLHGWGMRSIDQVICKYGGSKEYYLYDSLLEIFITIPV